MSHLCVHCPCSSPDDPAFAFEPRVVGAEGRFVLLDVRFAHALHHADDGDEYFVYTAAGRDGSPSLERIRRPGSRVPISEQLAVVPLAAADGQYLLAGRSAANLNRPFKYQLHVYSSADRTWTTRPLRDACHDGGRRHIFTSKVVSLGDGVVGWVDLRVGVLVCDLLRQSPSASVDGCLEVRFIPLPVPMPANRASLTEFRPGDPAWRFRDVAFSFSSNGGGVLKFVEIEHRWTVTTIAAQSPEPPELTIDDDTTVLLDSDLIAAELRERNRQAEKKKKKPRQVRKRDGWTMMTWSRTMASNCWRKGCVVDVDEIAVDDTVASALRSGVAGDEEDEDDAERFRFRNLYSAFPTLSTDDDDLVYLKSVARVNGPKGWMVAVDLGKKTLTALGGAYSFDRHDPCTYNDCICSLSNYLNIDPDSSQTTKPKDSADPLKAGQSSAEEEEASCPYKGKPRDAALRRQLLLELKAQEDRRSIREQHGAESKEECSSDSRGPLWPPPPLAAIPRNCLPPRAVIKQQSDGAGDRTPNPAAVSPVNNVVAARPTGSSLPPQVPVPVSMPVPPQQQQAIGQWSGAVNHPNAHAVVNHHHPVLHNAHAVVNHHLVHAETGLSRSCPPPQPVPQQQNTSHWDNGVSYQYQNHPWPPPHQQYSYAIPQAQQWNGAATGWYQEQQHPYTHGVNQNHWNAGAGGGYHCPPSANVNLQNQWVGGVGYGYAYGHQAHHSGPNLPASAAGQFPNQPGGVLPQQQTANQLCGGAPEQQWPATGSGGDAAQAWTPRKRWRGAE